MKVQTQFSMYTLHYSFLTNVIRPFHMNWMSYKCVCVICVCYCSHCCHHNFYYFNEVHWTCRGISMNSKWPFVTKRIKQKYVCVLSLIFNGFSLFFQCIEMNVNEPMKMHTQSCWVTYQSITQLRPWISILPHSYNFNVVIQWLIWTSTGETQLKKVLTWKPKESINLYQRFEIKNKVSYKNMKRLIIIKWFE